MKITVLTYQAVKNTGNYESKRLEASAQLDEGEDPNVAFKLLRDWVHDKLEPPPPEADNPF